VREQFLVEVTDTTSEDLAAAGVDHPGALLELNRLFMAWVETEYHRRTHSETGQAPLARWDAGFDRLGRTPAIPTADQLTEAFLWSEYRVVTKTATVSLLGKLALDRRLHGQGLGGQLLFDACQRTLAATRIVAARYLVVDAIDDEAARFYEHYGFIRSPAEPSTRMVRKISDIQADVEIQ
jgi:GNAT superfamily N-acetyltransferase